MTVLTDPRADVTLDITPDLCPITFVRTKLMIERMEAGQVAEVRLNDGEPLRNVPRSVEEHGHEILSLEPEAGGSSVWRLVLKKSRSGSHSSGTDCGSSQVRESALHPETRSIFTRSD